VAVEARTALSAELAAVVWLAGTLATHRLTVVASSAVEEALTGAAVRVPKVAIAATLTVGWLVLHPTLTRPSVLSTVACVPVVLTVARLTDICLVPLVALGPVESVLTLVTVDASGVVTAVLTFPSTLIHAVDVQGQPQLVYSLVVHTLLCVTKAVTWFTDKLFILL